MHLSLRPPGEVGEAQREAFGAQQVEAERVRMDITYDDELPECEECWNEVSQDDIIISMEEWKRILCHECMEDM